MLLLSIRKTSTHTSHLAHVKWHILSLHCTHHTHSTTETHLILHHWLIETHSTLLLLILLWARHHLIVVLFLLKSSAALISHILLLHELHLLLIHSLAHILIEVTTTLILIIVSLLTSHHLLVCHISSWSWWHSCLLILHRGLTRLRWWLILLGHWSLCVVLWVHVI